jgi:hypothetical protein
MKKASFLFLLIPLFLIPRTSAQDFTLIPYRIGDQWGFSDASKNMVIETKYDEVIPFNHGYTVFKQKNQRGILTETGKEIKAPAFDSVAGVFQVYSFYDKTSKKTFTDTAIGVYMNQKQVYINRRGELVKGEPETIQITTGDDLSRSEKGLKSKIYMKNKLYGLRGTDKKKKIVITAQYDALVLYRNNTANYNVIGDQFVGIPTYYLAKKGKLWGVITEANLVVLPFDHDTIYFESDYGIRFRKNSKYGVYTKEFKPKIEAIYDTLIYASGCFIFVQDNKPGVLSNEGKILIPIMYPEIKGTQDQYGFYVTDEEGNMGYYNKKGEQILKPKYIGLVKQYNKDAFFYTKKGLTGYFSVDGTIKIAAKYKQMYPFVNKYALVITKKGQKGYINEAGEEFFE